MARIDRKALAILQEISAEAEVCETARFELLVQADECADRNVQQALRDQAEVYERRLVRLDDKAASYGFQSVSR